MAHLVVDFWYNLMNSWCRFLKLFLVCWFSPNSSLSGVCVCVCVSLDFVLWFSSLVFPFPLVQFFVLLFKLYAKILHLLLIIIKQCLVSIHQTTVKKKFIKFQLPVFEIATNLFNNKSSFCLCLSFFSFKRLTITFWFSLI